ncbi:MAG TPA: glycosyltransferase family 39 protein, partial [Candidatus Sulfotelmatobacter sp.]|nr:glycosyltransferase family 39 protein [Candidatus Sulfotelmatobacter sp.]
MQKMPDTDFSFKNFFTPLTTAKAITIIIGVGLIVYFNMLFNGFVWDDYPQLVNNPLLQSWTNLVPIFLNHSYTYYRPFSDFVFAILYSVFNTTAFWYHLFQLILQITNTILVFLLFKKFFRPTISFILSIIFLVHPLQVETVSYISSLQNVLSLFLSLLALFIIMVKGIQPKYKYGTLFIILLFASLTKEIALVFIVVIFAFMKLNPQYVFSKKEYIYTGITLALVIFCYLIFRFLIGGMTPIVTNNTFVLIMTASFWMKILTLPK